MTWHALHVHYHDAPDPLLVGCVGPLVAEMRDAGLSGWFFLRYWEGGPHVRLRLRLEGPHARAALASAARRVRRHLARHPSAAAIGAARLAEMQDVMARLQGGGAAPDAVVPDNTVRRHAYVPEPEKYGGAAGLEVAEALFERSSDVALRVLAAAPDAPARRLGTAFTMMLAALRAAGLGAAETADFTAGYCRYWSRHVAPAVAAAWPGTLDARMRALAPHAAAALGGSAAGPPAPGSPAAEWAAAVTQAMAALDARAGAILPHVTQPGPAASPRQRRDYVLFNYLHTHDNRLGVMPAHEAHLAYLAHHAVCALADLPASADLHAPGPPAYAAH